tara:strand:+ start:483 stop:623 length:141 start_codon:yes stop_codon:yes gene_type:complete
MKTQARLLIEAEIRYLNKYLGSTLTTTDRKFFENRLKAMKAKLVIH